jgi:hypothetical protein
MQSSDAGNKNVTDRIRLLECPSFMSTWVPCNTNSFSKEVPCTKCRWCNHEKYCAGNANTKNQVILFGVYFSGVRYKVKKKELLT